MLRNQNAAVLLGNALDKAITGDFNLYALAGLGIILGRAFLADLKPGALNPDLNRLTGTDYDGVPEHVDEDGRAARDGPGQCGALELADIAQVVAGFLVIVAHLEHDIVCRQGCAGGQRPFADEGRAAQPDLEGQVDFPFRWGQAVHAQAAAGKASTGREREFEVGTVWKAQAGVDRADFGLGRARRIPGLSLFNDKAARLLAHRSPILPGCGGMGRADNRQCKDGAGAQEGDQYM